MKSILRAIAILSLLLQFASSAHAVLYRVNVDTSALVGGTFSLDFQLLGGDPNGNTATISNFNFGVGGGLPLNSSPTKSGDATGDIGSSVSLVSSAGSFFNELYQGFNPGATLYFDVNLTTSVNATPDAFSFAILDANDLNIPTTSPADALLQIDINGNVPNVQTFTSTRTSPAVTVTIPEPASLALVGLALAGVGLSRRKRT